MSDGSELSTTKETAQIPDDEPDLTIGEGSSEGATFTDEFVSEATDDFADLAGLDDHEGWTPPNEEEIRTTFYDVDLDEELEITETYWLESPYSFVVLAYDPGEREHVYHVVEPALDEFEAYVREDMTETLKNILLYVEMEGQERRWEQFSDVMHDVLEEYSGDLDDASLYKLRYYLMRDFAAHGAIEPLMNDRHIEDISCDGTGIPVYIYHNQYRDVRTNLVFENDAELNGFIQRLSERTGKHISVSNPLVDTSLHDGSRVQLTLGRDISTRGSNFTIRKFAETPITPVDLVDWNTFSADQMAYFWLAIENGMSLIFAGGTASGKTTSMNAVSFFVPPGAKTVSIEDTREITLPHENWVASAVRRPFTEGERGGVDMYDLLQTALRQRPEYLLVGEIRAEREVAHTFFQAIATGHTSYTTFHADSVDEMLSRMENEPLAVPGRMIQELDIVAVQRQITERDKRIRRTHRVSEITGGGPEGTEHRTVFEWDPTSDEQVQIADSDCMAEIKESHGWDDDRLASELDERKRLIEYIVESDVRDYIDVGRTFQMYHRDRSYIMEGVEDGSLTPGEFD
jgi:flagellar protein FlaI